MRTLLLAGWLLLPVGFAFWHFGPGQDHAQREDAGSRLALARKAVEAGEWPQAVQAYEAALDMLPEGDKKERHQIILEKAKAQLNNSQLVTAHADLKNLVEELQADDGTDRALLADARSTLAQSRFYMTWLMRLEGQPEEVWLPEIESARQGYRLLAEDTTGPEMEKHQKDLEAAVRLARLDLSDLQSLPLPRQCKGCCSCKNPGKKLNKGPKEKREDSRGASSGPPPDGTGH
jgi:hypothetical protein